MGQESLKAKGNVELDHTKNEGPDSIRQRYDRQKIKAMPCLKKGDDHSALVEVRNYLKHYGYLNPEADSGSSKLDETISQALCRFQKWFNIKATGVLDAETKDVMALSRCGIPDHDILSLVTANSAGPWSRRALTYAVGRLSRHVSATVARAALRRAFDTWTSAGVGLTFTEVQADQSSDIFIEWRQAADPDHNMVGGVLAHADFPPGYSIVVKDPPLPLHFDDEEHTWVDGEVAESYDIESVALHEIGHCLGLYHSNDASSVMYSTIPANHTNLLLQPDDLAGIRNLYPIGLAWQSLGGNIIGEPAVVSWGADRIEVFAQGTDNIVLHKSWDGSKWLPSLTGWFRLKGGPITDGPCAVARGPRLDLFARGTDNSVLHKSWDGQKWEPLNEWKSLGGNANGRPTAVAWATNRVDVFAQFTDTAVWHIWRDSSGWRPSWESLGGLTVGVPAAVAWGPNRLDVVVCGTDNGVYHKAWDGSAWRPSQTTWAGLGGVIRSSPVVVSWASNRLDIFVQGTGHGIFHRAWDGSAWRPSKWQPIGGETVSGPSAVAGSRDLLDIVIQGPDRGVWHKSWNGGSWVPDGTAWRPLSGKIAGTPVLSPLGSMRLEVFASGTDGDLMHWI